MKSTFRMTTILVLMLTLSSCAKIFISPNATSLAYNHHIIAILPPSVSTTAMIEGKSETIIEFQKMVSLSYQKAIHEWMLQKRFERQITPEIQDIETTNAKLKSVGYTETLYSSFELCEILGVDGILGSNFSLIQPYSDEDAIALALSYPAWGSDNEVLVSLNIQDCTTKELIWKFDKYYTGILESNVDRLIVGLMKHASKKMPYFHY